MTWLINNRVRRCFDSWVQEAAEGREQREQDEARAQADASIDSAWATVADLSEQVEGFQIARSGVVDASYRRHQRRSLRAAVAHWHGTASHASSVEGPPASATQCSTVAFAATALVAANFCAGSGCFGACNTHLPTGGRQPRPNIGQTAMWGLGGPISGGPKLEPVGHSDCGPDPNTWRSK